MMVGRGSLAALLAVLASSVFWILLIHAALNRLLRPSSPQVVAVIAGLVGMVPTALLAGVLAVPGGSVPRLWVEATYALMVYACIAYSYFHLFNLSETARRIRILRELHTAGSLTAEEISRLYSPALVIEVRLDRLVAAGQLELRGGRYVKAGRLLHAAAWVVRAWRLVLGFERPEPPKSI